VSDSHVVLGGLNNILALMNAHAFYSSNLPLPSVTTPTEPPVAQRKSSSSRREMHSSCLFDAVPFANLNLVDPEVLKSDLIPRVSSRASSGSSGSVSSTPDLPSPSSATTDTELEAWFKHIHVDTQSSASAPSSAGSIDLTNTPRLQFHLDD
jgi:hypothetical protein